MRYDAIVLGAGAAGLFFAGEAGKRGKRVLALDHAQKLGEKIRISGGGRCNFTNLHAAPEHFLSQNPKFCISALNSFSPRDFLARVEGAGIAWHEKALGQLFCDGSATQITDMLLGACKAAGVTIKTGAGVTDVSKTGALFTVKTEGGDYTAPALIIATGGKSIPKIGASGFGYQLAERFGLPLVEPRPALVPLIFEGQIKEMAKSLAAVSIEASVTALPEAAFGKKTKTPTAFKDGFLFTHRGLSGPSILQISSYWREGGAIGIDLSPGRDVFETLKARKAEGGKAAIGAGLSALLPRRLAQALCEQHGWSGPLAEWPDKRLRAVADIVHGFTVTPSGSEGYRTAEVTLGGISTAALHSKTMETKDVPGLFAIGEVADVTGWLGGYNFQWAWASAFAAAQAV